MTIEPGRLTVLIVELDPSREFHQNVYNNMALLISVTELILGREVERTKQEVKEKLIDLIGEEAWQYAYYNFDLKSMIVNAKDIYQLAEKIQDMIATDLQSKKT